MSSEAPEFSGEGYKLDIDELWSDRNVVVPEYFEATRNLYDQPPIAWALTDESIFPPAMFLPDSFDIGRAAFLNFWRRYWYKNNWYTLNAVSDGKKGRDHLTTLQTYMAPGSPAVDKFVPKVCRKLTASFEKYPRVREYLTWEVGQSKDFDRWGQPRNLRPGNTFESYMGWRAAGK